jgi:phosphonate transport system permease protein
VTEQEKLFRAFEILFWIGLVIVVAGIFGSLGAWLAERRGHSRRKWFWLGAFFWIFAIIALLVIKPGPDAPSVGVRAFKRRQKVWAGAAEIFADPDYEPDANRPEPPRRSITLLPALGITLAGFWIGGIFGDVAWGALWGVIGGASAIGALRVAKEKVDTLDMGVLVAGAVASAALTNLVLPDTPQNLTANLSIQMAGAWIPMGVASTVVLWRRIPSPARALTMMLGWSGAGLLALPAAVAWEVLKPVSSVVGEVPEFGTAAFAFIGITVGIIGGAYLLSGTTGLNALATMTTVTFMSIYAAAQVGFTIPGLIRNFTNMSAVGRQMWPPDFAWAIGTGDWWWVPSWDFGSELRANPLLETFRIAIIACLIGVTLAIPLALRASKITAIRGSDYWLNKGIMNVIRTVPDLFWAMIFATSVGLGPFAGTLALIFFSMAIMAKLLSETVDAVDPRPIEAARATGSHHWPAIRTSVWPQVLPNYVAYALYIFEINIRASVVLGIVGAGGIGRVLEAQRSFFRFDRVLAIVMVIFVVVFLIEQLSVALRRRLV